MIYDDYVRIMFIYNLFNDLDKYGSNTRHSMLALSNTDIVLIYKRLKKIGQQICEHLW